MKSSTPNRIAIVFPEQVYPGRVGGTRTLMDLALILKKKGYEVKVFSLGRSEKEVVEGEYSETVIPSAVATDSRSTFVRLLDYTDLLLAKTQYTYHIINNNRELYEAVEEYSPNFIISLGRMLTDFMLSYKSAHPGTKAVTITDDFRVVDNSLDIRREAAANYNVLKRSMVYFMSDRFREFSWRVYSRMINGLDAIVCVTDIDMEILEKRFPKAKGKFNVLPTAACDQSNTLSGPSEVNKKVSTIFFMGNQRHEPNLQAMQIIENKIAPRLPDKKFLILGSGIESKTVKNVEYTGEAQGDERFKLIDSADICIAPLMKGSGIKVKILDYMMRCKPVIATSIALEGYPVRDGVHFILENDPDKYAEQILRLEKDVKLRKELSKNCTNVCEYFSYDNIGNQWDSLLTKLAKHSDSAK